MCPMRPPRQAESLPWAAVSSRYASSSAADISLTGVKPSSHKTSGDVAPSGWVYHVLNRSEAGLPLFPKEADDEAFERIIIEAQQRHPMRVLAWCWMRNIGTSWFGRKRMGN